MQIKRLEISGFKSFMNPVALDFGGGITAILGPNGCGKSNVVDAMRWVLGEQSAKQLRGDKMQNVLFNGTRNRSALGMAEVAVSFSNTHGRLPVAYDEVRIARRLSRDGQSDYLLNGAPCRLKDIKDLITDTGAGSHAYSIIEREMVDGVIHGHEESRRFLFEEASGIMKYRTRRKEALRKLEMTEQDLLRINDILDEVSRQVRALRRQMGRARRYQELQTRLRASETYLAQQRLREYVAETAAMQAQLDALQVTVVGDDTMDDSLGARIEALRLEVVDAERAVRTAGAACEDIAVELKGSEDTILVLRGRSDSTREARLAASSEVVATEERLSQVRAERERLAAAGRAVAQRVESERAVFLARKQDLDASEAEFDAARAALFDVKQRAFDFVSDSSTRRSELDVLRARLETQAARVREIQEEVSAEAERGARLEDEHAGLTARLEAVDASRAARRVALADLDRRLEEAAADATRERDARGDAVARLEAARSRAEILRSLVAAHDGYGAGARALLERHAGGRVVGPLAEHVAAPAGLDAAVQALLHDVVDALVVRDADAAVDLLNELRVEGLGRATLVPLGFSVAASAVVRAASAMPGVMGAAVDLLAGAIRAVPALGALLSDAIVVEDSSVARRVLAHATGPLRAVTRDGMVFTTHGLVQGGVTTDASADASVLGRRPRLEEWENTAARFAAALAEHDAALATLTAQAAALRQDRHQLDAGLHVDDEEHHALAVSRAALETSIAEGSARRAQAGALLATLEAEVGALEARVPDLVAALESAARAGDVHDRTLAEREAVVAEAERRREALRHEVGELRVAFVTLQGESESHARQLERLADLERELADLCGRRRDEIARASQDLERYAAELAGAEERGGSQALRLASAREAREAHSRELEARRGALDVEQGRLHEMERTRREHEGRRHGLELSLSECTMRRQNLLDRMQELHQLDEAGLLALEFNWTDDDPVPDEAGLRELRAMIAALGPVNLLALEEHAEKGSRLEFLETQREDLVKASTSLRETIEKINQTAHCLFAETFQQVREHFRRTIRTVFDGGEGDLVLTPSPDDPLEADIEILVRPRGKKIDTLAQLSSGERALTAIALLFSIYLVKPSPFCIFDEVDAPLDDANVLRFVQLLQEFKDRTQFVVITHNKLTMEAADRLYGVTMEEEGVSKLVSVALDGNLRGVPRSLQKKTQRVRAAAVLATTAEAAAGAARFVAAPDEADAVLVGAGGSESGAGGDVGESRV